MLVWRYEHPSDGLGPYVLSTDGWGETVKDLKRRKLSALLRDKHGCSYKHPGPYSDGLVPPNWDSRVCGCASLEALRKWFWGFNKKLLEAGYEVRVYETKRPVRVSTRTKQTVFNKAKSRRIEG